MSSVSWTEDQQKVIDLRNRNILVSAAAGSGKTAVLVERIIKMITDSEHPVDIDHLLIVTFTNAAASEMRDRISKAVEKKLNEEPDNVQLQKQMALIHSAQITTIHSFCLNVIRNYFNTIDLDPSFRIGDDAELKLMQSDVVETLLEEKYEELSPEFVELVESYASGKSDSQLEGLILQLYHFSVSYPWPKEWLEQMRTAFDVEKSEDLEKTEWMAQLLTYIELILNDYVSQYERAKEICLEPDGPYQYEANITAEIEQLERIIEKKNYAELAEAFEDLTFGRLPTKRDASINPDKKEEVKKIRDGIKKGLTDIQKAYFFQPVDEMLADIAGARPAMNALIDLTIQFTDEFKAVKEEKGILDFNDLEHLALNILVNKKEEGKVVPSPVAMELSEFYDEILIDEYQDSNFVQETILTSISKERLGMPNVFMVGDVKQSIYKFRMARPELFMKKYESYSLTDSKYQRIDLHKNFRSRACVLDPINYIFEKIMVKNLGDITYDDKAALHVGATFIEDEGVSRNTEVLVVGEITELTSEEKEELAKKAREQGEEVTDDDNPEGTPGALSDYTVKELEAKAVAKRIKELTDENTGLKVVGKDKDGNACLRTARLSDIVILFRSMTGWSDVFVDVLLSEGIPAYADTQSGYFSTMEIRTILNILKVLDNPRQEIPLAAVIHSPIFNMTSEDLAKLKIGHKDMELYDNLVWYRGNGEDPELLRKVDQLFIFLDKYRSIVGYTSIYELISQIIEDTNYYYYVKAMPAGERRASNVEMLIQRAIDFESTSYSGLFDFNRYIEKLEKYEIDYGEASVGSESDEAVRIMSIHKSKGLEFPIVFVSGMSKKMNNQDAKSRLVLHADLGLGPDYINKKYRIKSPTLMKKVIQRIIMLENQAEELRVLYVALTRAKEKLIMTGYMKNITDKMKNCNLFEKEEEHLSYQALTSAGSYQDWVLEAMKAHPAFISAVKDLRAIVEDFSQADVNDYVEALNDIGERFPFTVRFENAGTLIHSEVIEAVKRSMIKEELRAFDTETVYDEEIHKELKDRLSYEYPFKADTTIHSKVTVSELKKLSMQTEEEESVELQYEPFNEEDMWNMESEDDEDEIEFEEAPVKAEQEELKKDMVHVIPEFIKKRDQADLKHVMQGAEVGTLYHRILELLDFRYASTLEDIKVQLDKMVLKEVFTKEEYEVIDPKRILHFVESPLGKRIVSAALLKTLSKEQQFVIGQPARTINKRYESDEMILVQGIIDLYFEEDGEIVLLDYKTDHVKKAYFLVKRYETQLQYYKQALEQMTHKKVKEVYIYSLYLEKAIEVNV
ncbi:MAG: helicase-exonuclease AddAB subunit AddA [bacterium]|nr:helicase-exonuclease AddAB subunit AddA [bacterium]